MPAGNSYPGPILPLTGAEQLTLFQQQAGQVVTTTASVSQLWEGAQLAIANVTATGATQATAAVLFALTNVITVGSDGSGVILIAGFPQKIFNRSGVDVFVYPQIGTTIESVGTENTPVLLPTGSQQTFTPSGFSTWYVG